MHMAGFGSPLSKSGVLNNHWEQDVLADQVLRRAPTNALMVDAGMNLGYYTLLARMHGLRTMSIDIQNPHSCSTRSCRSTSATSL
jgi:hypothetical protein